MATADRIGVLGADFEQALRPRRHWAQTLWTLTRQNPLGAMGFAIIFVLIVVAVFAPLIAPFSIDAIAGSGGGEVTENPSWTHLFGTDNLGRDMFSRVLFGARISLMVGFLSVGGGTAIAVVLGIISGYMGGIVDNIIQRTVDTAIAW